MTQKMKDVYIIVNATGTKLYKFAKTNSDEVYHWIVNHLDLSENWSYSKQDSVSSILYDRVCELKEKE